MTESKRGNFFAISREHFHDACDLGIGPATAYLVIACGTGRSQSKSRWSTGAIAEYGKINFPRAIKYITTLEDAGLLVNIGTRKKPLYEFTMGDEVVWLPNSIVTSADRETPAVARLRQTRDVELMRFFVDLYFHQNLGHDGGIDPEMAYFAYDCRRLGEYGPFTIYVAEKEGMQYTARDNPLVTGGDFGTWWERFNKLENMGLIVRSVYLFDGPVTRRQANGDDPDGEFVYALNGPSAEEKTWEFIEYNYMSNADQRWIDYALSEEERDCFVLVPKHITTPIVIGLYRMRHTAHTAAASTWWARINEGSRQLFKMMGKEEFCPSIKKEAPPAPDPVPADSDDELPVFPWER